MIKLGQMVLKGVNWVQNTNIFSIKSTDLTLNQKIYHYIHKLNKKYIEPLAPDSKLKLNVISHTFNLKSVGFFYQNPRFFIKIHGF